jgi:hypothetical protein
VISRTDITTPDLRNPLLVTADFWVSVTSARSAEPEFTGKWLVFVPSASVGRWWPAIRDACLAGDLGPRAKCSTLLGELHSPHGIRGTYVICAYTADHRDRTDVRRVLAGLRAVGIDWRLSYKMNAATLAGRHGQGSALYVSDAGAEFRGTGG